MDMAIADKELYIAKNFILSYLLKKYQPDSVGILQMKVIIGIFFKVIADNWV